MRLVQVGLGRWGSNWAASIVPRVPEVDPVGYVDVNQRALGDIVAAGVARTDQTFGSIDAAIAATKADAVLVTANLPGHTPAVTAALEAGVHVLVEKPFAPSVSEAQALVELAAGRGLTLMVSQNYRFHPAVRAVQSLVRSGRLGELHTVNVDFRKHRGKGPRTSRRPPLAEPLLGDMAIHHFDLLRAVTGVEVVEVDCRSWLPDGYDFGGPPAAAALLTLSSGVVVSYRGSWISPGPETTWAGDWRMEFEQGELCWTSEEDETGRARPGSVRIRTADGEDEIVEPPAIALLNRAGSLAEFVAAIEDGRPPETSGADNIGSLAISYAAIESARVRRPVAI